MPYKRKCKVCKRGYGEGISMVKLTRNWLCMECFAGVLRKRYG